MLLSDRLEPYSLSNRAWAIAHLQQVTDRMLGICHNIQQVTFIHTQLDVTYSLLSSILERVLERVLKRILGKTLERILESSLVKRPMGTAMKHKSTSLFLSLSSTQSSEVCGGWWGYYLDSTVRKSSLQNVSIHQGAVSSSSYPWLQSPNYNYGYGHFSAPSGNHH